MPANGRWFVTPHAVLRMRQLCPRLTYDEALAFLIRESETARFVRMKNPDAALYRGARPFRHRYIVAPAKSPDELPVLLTVLPTHDGAAGRKEIDDARVGT